jgi:hypothetical protein
MAHFVACEKGEFEMVNKKDMKYLTESDHYWMDILQNENNDCKYEMVIDNIEIWIRDIPKQKCVHVFSLNGIDFIHGLFKDKGINVKFYWD